MAFSSLTCGLVGASRTLPCFVKSGLGTENSSFHTRSPLPAQALIRNRNCCFRYQITAHFKKPRCWGLSSCLPCLPSSFLTLLLHGIPKQRLWGTFRSTKAMPSPCRAQPSPAIINNNEVQIIANSEGFGISTGTPKDNGVTIWQLLAPDCKHLHAYNTSWALWYIIMIACASSSKTYTLLWKQWDFILFSRFLFLFLIWASHVQKAALYMSGYGNPQNASLQGAMVPIWNSPSNTRETSSTLLEGEKDIKMHHFFPRINKLVQLLSLDKNMFRWIRDTPFKISVTLKSNFHCWWVARSDALGSASR